MTSSSSATPCRGLSRPDQGLADAEATERHAAADRRSARRSWPPGRTWRGAVASSPSHMHRSALEHEQVPALHAVVPAIVQQPLAPGQPAAAARRLALDQQGEAEPERAPSGLRSSAAAQERVMRTRPGVGALGVPADQVRGDREPLEVFGLERRLAIRGRRAGLDAFPQACRPKDARPRSSESATVMARATGRCGYGSRGPRAYRPLGHPVADAVAVGHDPAAGLELARELRPQPRIQLRREEERDHRRVLDIGIEDVLRRGTSHGRRPRPGRRSPGLPGCAGDRGPRPPRARRTPWRAAMTIRPSPQPRS